MSDAKLTPREQLQKRTEEMATQKVQIQIHNKKTGAFVDHAEASPENAQAKARSMIAGKKDLGFKIISVI